MFNSQPFKSLDLSCIILDVAEAGGPVDGGGAELVLEIDVGVVLEEHSHDVLAVPRASVEQGGPALVGARVDLGALLQKELDNVLVSRGAGDDQRSPSTNRYKGQRVKRDCF